MQLKEYIHYYIGSRFRVIYPDGDFLEDILEWVGYDGYISGENRAVNKKGNFDEDQFDVDAYSDKIIFKLILIHPCDLSKEQKDKYKSLCYPIKDLYKKKQIVRYADTPQSMHYLFKNGIDAFDLIDQGLAIDKNTII